MLTSNTDKGPIMNSVESDNSNRLMCKCNDNDKGQISVDNIDDKDESMQNSKDESSSTPLIKKAYSLITRPYITLFGDSLTERSTQQDGFSRMLLDIYGRKADLRVRGVSGYNTKEALDVLDIVFPPPDPLQYCINDKDRNFLSIIFFGANDAVLKGMSTEPERHVSLEEYGTNLQKIIDRVHDIVEVMPSCSLDKIGSSSDLVERGSTSLPYIILVTPPPLLDSRIRKNHVTQQYAEKVVNVANANPSNVKVLDIFTKMGGHNTDTTARAEYLLMDGLHFNSKGQKVFLEELLELIEKSFPHFDPLNLPSTEHSCCQRKLSQ